MRTEGRESENVEDRRGQGTGRLGGIRIGRGGGLGVGTIAIALVASYFLGVDPSVLLGMLGGAGGGSPVQMQAPTQSAPGKPTDEMGRFMSVVLADTEDTWKTIFRAGGRDYPEPKLVLFERLTPTACGTGQSAAGPFYCPLDQKIYLDLSFFRLLQERFRAPGDFARAYVLAHEVGHHVQNQLGVMEKVQQMRRQLSEAQANAMSVRVELQADCFAGIWAHHANRSRQLLESGDLEEALGAASAIGDDVLQRKSQGTIVPESFTHGSAEQRVRWFRVGFENGQMASCDTFNAARP